MINTTKQLLAAIPDTWKTYLDLVKIASGVDNVYIAGGCLRDLMLGRPIKDIDIFIGYEADRDGFIANMESVLEDHPVPINYAFEIIDHSPAIYDTPKPVAIPTDPIGRFKYRWGLNPRPTIGNIIRLLPPSAPLTVVSSAPTLVPMTKSQATSSDYANYSKQINFVEGFTTWDLPIEFQVIAFNNEELTAKDLLKSFDFGLCQIAYDGTDLHYTDEFISDVMNETFTVVRQVLKPSKTKDRYHRFYATKYYGWTLQDPEGYLNAPEDPEPLAPGTPSAATAPQSNWQHLQTIIAGVLSAATPAGGTASTTGATNGSNGPPNTTQSSGSNVNSSPFIDGKRLITFLDYKNACEDLQWFPTDIVRKELGLDCVHESI